MVGLGVMGRNLLLNMADHGFSVAGYDKDQPFTSVSRIEEASTEVIFRDISVEPHTETSHSNRRGDLPDLELLAASLRISS